MTDRDFDSLHTRASLLRRVKNLQDQSSWEEFYDTYRPIILGFALKAGLRPEEAADVVQETYAALVQALPEFNYNPAQGYFRSWLLRLASWRVIDQLRKRWPLLPADPAPADESSQTSTLHRIPDPASLDLNRIWDEQWAAQVLATASTNVRRKAEPRCFQIFDLCANQEWPPKKVAEMFGIPVGQVYLIKHRIMAMLKEEVKRIEARIG